MAPKAEVLTRFRSAVDAFDAVIEDLTEDRLCEPAMDGWSVRDLTARFAGYHADMASAIERVGRGEPPAPGDGLTDDERNARYAEDARTRPVAEVLRDWRLQFERCYVAAAALPEEHFEERAGVSDWLLEEAAHDDGHGLQVRGWLGHA